MHGYSMVRVCIFLIISVKGELNTTMLMNSYGSKICPFTNFCQLKATKILNNETLMPCCLSCSCEANCWKVGNCCPDRNVNDFELPDIPCKETLVKWRHSDTFVYHGHTDGIERYRIKDSCLPNENNETLITLCEGKNKTTVEEYTWVSEKSSGRIFQNRYCALCNNISGFIEWGLKTRYWPVLVTNVAHLSRILLSDKCDLVSEIPESQLKLAESFRCFMPSVSKCNVSGLWTHFDEGIVKGCETYNSPIFVPKVDIFKNIYCYICNIHPDSAAQTMCANWQLDDSKWGATAFSALIDFKGFQYDGDEIRNTECREEEIYDQFTALCRKLICPFGGVAYDGKCKNMALQTHGLTVKVQYNIQIPQNVSNICKVDFETLDKESLGKTIKSKFIKSLGVRKSACPMCGYDIRLVEGIQQDFPTEFIITTKIYTDFDCQLDSIYNLATEVFGKELKLTLGDCLSFKMIYRLEKRSLKVLSHLAFTTIYDDRKHCPDLYTLDREKICPEVQIAASDLTSWLGKNNQSNSYTWSKMTEDIDNNTITLCWQDYVTTMSNIYTSSSSSLLLTPGQIPHAILPLAVYHTIHFSAFLYLIV